MKRITLIAFSILFFACAEKQAEDVPSDILSKEKMAAVLLDVHLLESSMNMGATPNIISSAPASTKLAVDVFKKNGISKAQYNKSMDYYSLHPAKLSEIYQLVLNDLSKMQAQINSH